MTFELVPSEAYAGSYYLYDRSASGAFPVAMISKSPDGVVIRVASEVKVYRDGVELQETYVETNPDVLASDYPKSN